MPLLKLIAVAAALVAGTVIGFLGGTIAAIPVGLSIELGNAVRHGRHTMTVDQMSSICNAVQFACAGLGGGVLACAAIIFL